MARWVRGERRAGVTVRPVSGDSQDPRFLARLQSRDERAFNDLVLEHQGSVFRLALRLLGGRREEAQDVTQDVFIQVFKGLDVFRGEASLSTWIYKITVNLCKNRSSALRRRPTEGAAELDAPGIHAAVECSAGAASGAAFAGPEQAAERRQLQTLTTELIGQLDADFREALILREVEELSYEEIAEVTGVAVGTVRSRLHRARGLLKGWLDRALAERTT